MEMLEANDLSAIDELLKINELNLDSEIATCAAYYYRLGCYAAEAEDMYEKATVALETYETQLASALTFQNNDITQTEVKRSFKTDPKWQAIKSEQLKLQKNFKILEKATRALDIKSKMLMSLNRRQLFKTQMGMNPNDE